MWCFNSIVVLVFIWLGDGSRLNKSCLHDLGVPNHHCYWVLMWTSIDTLWDPTKILEYLPKKAKIQILIENPDPTFISEMWTKGISNRPWLNDYNGIMNQRYKFWTPQGRIPKKFTVLEKPKEEQSLTFSDFLFNSRLYYNECMLLIRHD